MKPTWLFIGGLHRSGTSILNRLVHSHPDVSGFANTGAPEDEGQHLQTVYPTARAFGGPGRFCFDPGAHMTEASTETPNVDGWKLMHQWATHLDLSRKALIEKSPPNLIRTRYLQAMFPDAKFVIIVRHPIAVAMATSKWCSDPLERLIEHWCVGHELFLSDAQMLRHVLVLRYEDFVSDPQRHLDCIYGFIGLGSVELNETVSNSNGRYFEAWERLGDMAHIERLEKRYEALLSRFGYRLKSPQIVDARRRPPPAPQFKRKFPDLMQIPRHLLANMLPPLRSS